MTVVFAIVLVIHGLIHFLGFAKAFNLADLPQLTRPISQTMGALWLVSGLLFIAAAAALYWWPRGWWLIGLCAVAFSMIAIAGSWADAKFGAIGNLIVAIGIVFGLFSQGPLSLRAEYDREVRATATSPADPGVVSEADLVNLPAPVQRYLRFAGVVGKPRVHNVFARMTGRIRSGPDASWIRFTAEQHNFFNPPARLFYLTGTMFGIPVHGYHRYVGPSATMRVKAAGLVPVVDVAGAEMDQGETVTLFNDMCVLAPATLISPAVEWQSVDAQVARATYKNAGQTIRAELTFNEAGQLTNFRSDDRYQADGKNIRRVPWSTPLWGYHDFQSARLASTGEGRWHESAGEYAYIELTIDTIEYNVAPR